jgi:hypothetical protein
MRYKVINDLKLKSIIDMKDKIVKEIQQVQKDIDEKNTELNKLLLKVQRYDDKAKPLIEQYTTEKLEEFEQYSRLYLQDGEIRLEVVDRIEEYKKALREQAEKAKEKEQLMRTS